MMPLMLKRLRSWLKRWFLPGFTPPPQIYYERKPRLAQRASLLEWRTQVSNQLHALSVPPVVVPAVRERLVQFIDTINHHIAKLDAELLELVKIEQEPRGGISVSRTEIEQQWKAALALLLTIPDIGLLTACWLVVATLNFSTCETAEAATHYLGLAPIVREPRHECARPRPNWAWWSCSCQDALVFSNPGRSAISSHCYKVLQPLAGSRQAE